MTLNYSNHNFDACSVNSNSFIVLCKPGLNEYCFNELKDLSSLQNIDQISVFGESVIFSLADNDLTSLNHIFERLGTIYSFSKLLWRSSNLDSMASLTSEEATDLLSKLKSFIIPKKKNFSFRVLCESISGNETRIEYTSLVQGALKNIFRQAQIELTVDYKNPEVVFSLSVEEVGGQKTFSLGLRLHKTELDKREWRIYTHKASFRGDFASAICQITNVKKSSSVLFLYSRDGALAIEAICQKNNLPLRRLSSLLENLTVLEPTPKTQAKQPKTFSENSKIICIDETKPNIHATKNNAKMIAVDNQLTFHCIPLDELKENLGENAVNTAVIHLTTKDERRINDIFSHFSEILIKNAHIYFITRPGFEIEGDSSHSLEWQKVLPRGSGSILITCIKRK